MARRKKPRHRDLYSYSPRGRIYRDVITPLHSFKYIVKLKDMPKHDVILYVSGSFIVLRMPRGVEFKVGTTMSSDIALSSCGATTKNYDRAYRKYMECLDRAIKSTKQTIDEYRRILKKINEYQAKRLIEKLKKHREEARKLATPPIEVWKPYSKSPNT